VRMRAAGDNQPQAMARRAIRGHTASE
jgi:hypothetical protein